MRSKLCDEFTRVETLQQPLIVTIPEKNPVRRTKLYQSSGNLGCMKQTEKEAGGYDGCGMSCVFSKPYVRRFGAKKFGLWAQTVIVIQMKMCQQILRKGKQNIIKRWVFP